MHPINRDRWKEWNQKGWIPFLEESDDQFIRRIHSLHNFLCSLSEEQETLSEKKYREVLCILREKFDLYPDWLPIFYSNKNLPLYCGAATTIFEEKGVEKVYIQLRKQFAGSDCLWRIYQRKELIVHECMHAVRYAFREPIYEEVLAYMSSSSSLRKILGPLFSSQLFSIGVCLSALCLWSLILLSAWWEHSTAEIMIHYLIQGFLLWISFFWFRSLYYRKRLQKCHDQLSPLCKEKSWAVIYRLSDREILFFAGKSPEYIRKYVEKKKEDSIRWAMIASYICPDQ